jgi:putative transposase
LRQSFYRRIIDWYAILLSDRLTRDYKVICPEDLNVKGMVKNGKLALPNSDAGFGTLRRMIEYKAELRGVRVAVVGRFEPTSRTCSECGQLRAALELTCQS